MNKGTFITDLNSKYECKPSLGEWVYTYHQIEKGGRIREERRFAAFKLKDPEENTVWESTLKSPTDWLVDTTKTVGGPLILVDYELLQADPNPTL
jgi:hypothetical protein